MSCGIGRRRECGVRVVTGFGEDAFVSFSEFFSKLVGADPADAASFCDGGVNSLPEVEVGSVNESAEVHGTW